MTRDPIGGCFAMRASSAGIQPTPSSYFGVDCDAGRSPVSSFDGNTPSAHTYVTSPASKRSLLSSWMEASMSSNRRMTLDAMPFSGPKDSVYCASGTTTFLRKQKSSSKPSMKRYIGPVWADASSEIGDSMTPPSPYDGDTSPASLGRK